MQGEAAVESKTLLVELAVTAQKRMLHEQKQLNGRLTDQALLHENAQWQVRENQRLT